MGLSVFQRGVCQLLAQNRLRSGESYLAEGAALNELLRAPRLSRDLDLFHDAEEALTVLSQADVGRQAVEANHGQQGRQHAKEVGLEFLYKTLLTGEDRRPGFLVS